MANCRYLGSSGLKVSAIAYGNGVKHALQVGEEAALATVHAALDAGTMTAIDTALAGVVDDDPEHTYTVSPKERLV